MTVPNDINPWWLDGWVPIPCCGIQLVRFPSYPLAESVSDTHWFCASVLVPSWPSCRICTVFHDPFVLVRFDHNTRRMIYIE